MTLMHTLVTRAPQHALVYKGKEEHSTESQKGGKQSVEAYRILVRAENGDKREYRGILDAGAGRREYSIDTQWFLTSDFSLVVFSFSLYLLFETLWNCYLLLILILLN